MKELPITFKNIFIFLMLVAMTYGFTWLYTNFSKTIKDEPAEETIEFKYSKKGLYLYPRFEILVSNSERPSTVSKEQFESIHVGDKISGYMKNADTFVTEKDIQFEKALGIPILIALYLGVLTFGISLLKSMKFIKNNQTRTRLLQKTLKISIYTILTLYILLGMIFIALIATNISHKMNKWNQTEVEATVLGGDFNETRSHRGASYTTYELFFHYQDQGEEDYMTKKADACTTYRKYNKGIIPLIYRNSNVYDTFILTKSANEIWPAFFNLYTFFIGFYLVSLFAMFKAWRKRNNKQENQEETWSTI